MGASSPFPLQPPTEKDLAVAQEAWSKGRAHITLPTGQHWWRVLKARSLQQASEFAQVCYASDARSRFTPLYLPGTDTVVPAAYAGRTQRTALWEGVLRNIRHDGIRRVPEHDIRDRYLIRVELARTLRLFDIRRPKDSNLVAAGRHVPELSRLPPESYGHSRAWAQALYTQLADLDGLLYESHMVEGDCIMICQRDDVPIFAVAGIPTAVNRSPSRAILLEEVAKLDGAIDFAED